jgi:hypothetical protein
MFARKVAARLKPNSMTEFTNLIAGEVLPWLRKQEGFLDLLILAAPDGLEVAIISFWDQQCHAQTYAATAYPEALKILEKLLDAPPYVKLFDVVGSTFQWVTRTQQPGAEALGQPPASPQIEYRSHETRA